MANTGRGVARGGEKGRRSVRSKKTKSVLSDGNLTDWASQEVSRCASLLEGVDAKLEEVTQKLCDGEEVDANSVRLLMQMRKLYVESWRDAAKLKEERGQQVSLDEGERRALDILSEL